MGMLNDEYFADILSSNLDRENSLSEEKLCFELSGSKRINSNRPIFLKGRCINENKSKKRLGKQLCFSTSSRLRVVIDMVLPVRIEGGGGRLEDRRITRWVFSPKSGVQRYTYLQ